MIVAQMHNFVLSYRDCMQPSSGSAPSSGLAPSQWKRGSQAVTFERANLWMCVQTQCMCEL